MTQDWLLVKIDAVEQAAEAARDALSHTIAVLEPSRVQRGAGVPLVSIAQELVHRAGRPRRDASARFRAYERAVAELRGAVVRSLVDDEGIPVATLAEWMGVSRQVVNRLYRLSKRDFDGSSSA